MHSVAEFNMRTFAFVGVFLLGLSQGAGAADLDRDYLRGSVAYEEGPVGIHDWSGFYAGGQVGYSNANLEFGNATRGLVAFILRDTTLENEGRISDLTTLPNRDVRDSSFGGFVGYNTQWDDAVVGLEFNYNRMGLTGSAADSIGRSFQTSDGYLYSTDVAANASLRLVDYATFRARGGWVIGNFMPYAMIGVAVGRADVTQSATVVTNGIDISGAGRPDVGLSETRSDRKKETFGYGFAVGGGVDVLLLPNVFLRGEYEYVQFDKFGDTEANIHTVRGALGVKFW